MSKKETGEKALAMKSKDLQVDYDEKADVLYVTFGTGELSFSEELDDDLVLDFGIYSGAPTGFQLLHVVALQIIPWVFRQIRLWGKELFFPVRVWKFFQIGLRG